MARYVPNTAASGLIKKSASGHVEDIADQVAEDARRLAPVETGELRSSIVVTGNGGDTISIEAHTDYAAFVELGTSNMDAQPFLRPALYRTRGV